MVEQVMSYGLVWITPGELADRLSILEIKREKSYSDPNELADLRKQWDQLGIDYEYVKELKAINLEAWYYVDKIYSYFDDDSCKWPDTGHLEIVATCRQAHKLNKRRVTLKNEINEKLGVKRKEVKTWK
jgi:hypothetical protein